MAETVNISPTIIIGLGGTGSLALQYVKRKIRARLEGYKREGGPLPEQIPFIEYMVIDTTAQEEMLDGYFVPADHLNIGRLNISRILTRLEQEADDDILKWFPSHLDPGQIDSGAGGVRAIGRLCFFLNQARIENSLRNKIRGVTDSVAIKSFVNEHLRGLKYEEGSTIDVHLVTSLCGGTGSACLLDTAYLVKHIVNDDLQQITNSTAHLVTPEPFEGEPGIGRSSREYIQYNFAVTLSEIEHFTRKNASAPWEVRYKDGTRVISREKPFSVAYLLGCKEGVSLSKRHICEVIGEAIAIKTVHPDGRDIKGIIENHKPHVLNTEDARQKRRTYSSYNARVLDLGVDQRQFQAAVKSTARSIAYTLSEERPALEDERRRAFEEFERRVFFAQTKIPRLKFETLRGYLLSKVSITPDMFTQAWVVIKNVASYSKRRWRNEKDSLVNKVNLTCVAPVNELHTELEFTRSDMLSSLDKLLAKTDEEIKDLVCERAVPHVRDLLKDISNALDALLADFDQYIKGLPDPSRNFDEDIASAIQTGDRQRISVICADRARAQEHAPLFKAIRERLEKYKGAVDDRERWCTAAQQCLEEVARSFPEERHVMLSSHTVSYVWTRDALDQLAAEAKERLARRFMKLLGETRAAGDGAGDKVHFLQRLNVETPESKQAVVDLVRRAADDGLRAEVAQNAELKFSEALATVHEFVELASPSWQIERLGEDIAVVSLTNCPEDSDSGRIIARYGKNIKFSRNDSTSRELILFHSEHGASINHLINFRKCLKAVSRKMNNEGMKRLNELCLDPNWNIAAPLPIEEEMERLCLHFTVGVLFGLIEWSQMNAYTFVGAAGNTVRLSGSPDATQAVRRFEAFNKLLDLDCDGSEDCAHLRRMVTEMIEQHSQVANARAFNQSLLTYQMDLRRHMDEARNDKDHREERQLGKELESLQRLLDNVTDFINKTGHNGHGG